MLAADAIVGDGLLAGGRDHPGDELLPGFLLDVGMLRRIHEHDAVLVEEAPVARHGDGEVLAVPEREPGAAVGEDVGVHRGGGVQRRPHARAGVAVPGALDPVEIDAGQLPQAQLGGVRAAAVAARDEGRPCRLDLLQRRGDVASARHSGRVVARPDEDEVVVHDLGAPDAVAGGDELLLGGGIMHEDHVGIAAPRQVERLAGAEGDDAHLDAAQLLENRQQVAEEAGLLGRGGGGDGDEVVGRGGLQCESAGGEQQMANRSHGSSSWMKAAAWAVRGWRKNSAAGVCSSTRPASR